MQRQKFVMEINLNWKFTDTNQGIKKTATLSKQLPLYKLKGTQKQTISLPEDDVKC